MRVLLKLVFIEALALLCGIAFTILARTWEAGAITFLIVNALYAAIWLTSSKQKPSTEDNRYTVRPYE